MKLYQIAFTLSHVYWHRQLCSYLESCIDQRLLKELMVAAFQKPNRRQNVTSAAVVSVKLCSLQPSSIDWLDKCTFPDISLRLCVQMMMLVYPGGCWPFVTLTCSGSGWAVWGRGRVAGEEWINRQTCRQIISRPQTLCAHMLRLSACQCSLCSVPNIITLQGHAVYSSVRLGIRYENSLSIRVCVYVCL